MVKRRSIRAEEMNTIAHTTTRGKIWLPIHSEHGNDFVQATGFQRDGETWLRLSCANWGVMMEVTVNQQMLNVFERLIENYADHNAEG